MANYENLNVGVITVYDVTACDPDKDIFLQRLEKLLSSQTYFTALTCKNRKIEKNLSKLKFLLEEWSEFEDVKLIFVVGSEIFPVDRILDKNCLVSHHKQFPHIEKLVRQDDDAVNLVSPRYKCYVNHTALIISLLSSMENLEYFEKHLLADVKLALQEIKAFSKSRSSFSLEPLKEKLLKSQVVPLKVADRPRQSIFPMLSVTDAVKCVLDQSKVLPTTWKGFEDSLSYVLGEDVIAKEPYPPFNASVKDGYAVLADDETTIRNVIGVVTPGCELDFDFKNGTCVRVSTGSAIPVKSDAVIQVEDTVVAEKDSEGNELKIEILKPAKKLQDIRIVGSDVSVGEVLIPSKRKMTAAEIGVLAVGGITKVLVFQKPWVALLSTGDEILEPHLPLKPGCIRDSNKSSLMSLLIENKIPFIDAGIARDTADDIKSHLVLAMESADIIISTGSVSMGEKDLLKPILQQDFDAKIHFGRVHMKPGKPTTFSTAMYNEEKKLIFSLPGNPVSACVCFYLFVIPCIKKLMGYKEPEHKCIKVELGHDIKLDERPEFYRVSLTPGINSTFIAHSTGNQQSSRLLSMQNADALLVLPPRSNEQKCLEAGSVVNAILLQTI